jgi:ribonuclease BN (tRNA processing enzyme)
MLEAKQTYHIDSVSMTTSVRHRHPVETYGMVFRSSGHSVGYLADTRYFEGLTDSYKADVVIINMVLTEPRPIDHLSIPDAERIIKEIKPQTAILSHFGMHVWQARPWRIAEELSQRTGVRVIAARDGLKFDLGQLKET